MPVETSLTRTPLVRARWFPLIFLPAGAVLALGFPNDLVPGALGDRPPAWVAWLALLPFWWAVLRLPPRAALWAAWAFAAGFGLTTLSWMRLFTLLPWMLLALLLSLLPPLACLLAARMRLPRPLLPLGIALAWAGLEWLRGQGTFGFPWAEIGASQVDGVTAAIAAVGGLPLLTFFMLWSTGSVLLAVLERGRARWVAGGAVLAVGVACCGGYWQTSRAAARWAGSAQLQRVTVVQPNVLRGLTPAALVTHLSDAERRHRLDVLLTLSARAVRDAPPTPASTPSLLIWPETAISEEPYDLAIEHLCRDTNSFLLLGAPRYDVNTDRPRNTAFLLDPRGRIAQEYAKVHLVPFGEFVPMRTLVVDTLHFTVRDNDILPGAGWAPLTATGQRLGVGICFESTFPQIARTYAARGAQLLIFITNDAWFHRTCAVRQHFNHARFRAIETGLPVARAAGTGISGFIAPDGRILDAIPVYRTGTRTRLLPLATPGTLYTAGGWLAGPAALTLALLLVTLAPLRTWYDRHN